MFRYWFLMGDTVGDDDTPLPPDIWGAPGGGESVVIQTTAEFDEAFGDVERFEQLFSAQRNRKLLKYIWAPHDHIISIDVFIYMGIPKCIAVLLNLKQYRVRLFYQRVFVAYRVTPGDVLVPTLCVDARIRSVIMYAEPCWRMGYLKWVSDIRSPPLITLNRVVHKRLHLFSTCVICNDPLIVLWLLEKNYPALRDVLWNELLLILLNGCAWAATYVRGRYMVIRGKMVY